MAASQKKSGEEGGGNEGESSLGDQGRVERKNAVLRERRVPRERVERCGGGMRERRCRA